MIRIERNSTVTLFYRLGLTNDEVLEDIFDDEPVTIELGQGEMAEGLELALLGLKEGDEQTIDIGPELAFGFPDETLYRAIPRSEFDPSFELEQGLIIEFATDEGETLPGTVMDFDDNLVHVDLNHPLAGHDVRYTVKILSVENPPETFH